jgi:hypothetical protein
MFGKILGYFKYRKIIKQNMNVLSNRYKFRYDRLYGRLYTVLNITEDKQAVLRNYGYDFLDNEVKKFISSIDGYFFTIGLTEVVSISKIDRIDTVNVLIVLRYKYKYHQALLYIFFGIILLLFTSVFVAGLVKVFIMLINFIMLF